MVLIVHHTFQDFVVEFVELLTTVTEIMLESVKFCFELKGPLHMYQSARRQLPDRF